MKFIVQQLVTEVVSRCYSDVKEYFVEIERPKQSQHGDYACNVALVLAKTVKQSPLVVAQQISAELQKDPSCQKYFSQINVIAPGFINFFISPTILWQNVSSILQQAEKFGESRAGSGKTVVIDYSSINIAKPMHVGHLRSTIIGQSLYNIYKTLGYTVIGDNHIGDWGTQFGKILCAYKKWGRQEILTQRPLEEMQQLYIRFHQEAQDNSELEECARQETKKLQNGDMENLELWKFFVQISLQDADKIYQKLGVKFDLVLGESFYNPFLAEVVQDALQKGVATVSEGAVVVMLEKFNLPPLLIQKSDGGFLYATTDLATIKYRQETLKADEILYVVSNEQALYFEQLFAAANLLGYDRLKMQHIKFGMVLGADGKKFSTRKGETVGLMDVLQQAELLAQQVLSEKRPDMSPELKNKIAAIVGVGAVKYNDLSQNRLTDIVFNWDKMLSFEGDSAPYLQYTYARICSVLSKASPSCCQVNTFDDNFVSWLTDASLAITEQEVLRWLLIYPEIIISASEENSPRLVALYLYRLANLYNSFYSSQPILKAENEKLVNLRVLLSMATKIVLRNGLGLLGVAVSEEM